MPLRLLVVDDNRDTADSLAMALQVQLQPQKHEVRVAYSGQEAIAAAQAFHPDVLIMDLMMPGLSGFEVATRLRARPEFAHAHFIACTGLDEQSHLDAASKAQFDDYIVKPPELSVLLAILSEVSQRTAM